MASISTSEVSAVEAQAGLRMRRLSLSAGMLAAAQVGGQIIGLAMLVIVSRKIGPAYLGAYAFCYSVLGYVGLVAMGLPVLGMRDLNSPRTDRRRVLIDTIAVQVSLALVLGTILVGISPWITPSFASRVLLPILTVQLLINALTVDWYLQGVGRHSVVAASRFLGQIAYAAVLLPLLAGGLAGARHYAFANLAGLGATAAIMLLLVARTLGPSFERINLKPIRLRLTRSMPFLWWAALTQIYYSTDLILVAYLAGDRKAGLYAAASKLPLAVIGVAALWFTVSMPETARLHATTQIDVIRRQSRVAATTAIVAGLPFIVLGPIFATRIAITLFGPRFAGSGPALAILSASVAVSLLQIVITSVVMGAGRERPYVRAMSVGAALNVGLNLILIPRIGIVGAAISTMVSEILVREGCGLYVPPEDPVPPRPSSRSIRQAGATACVAGLLALLLCHEAGFVAGAVGAIAVYAVVIGVRTARNPRWLDAWLGNS